LSSSLNFFLHLLFTDIFHITSIILEITNIPMNINIKIENVSILFYYHLKHYFPATRTFLTHYSDANILYLIKKQTNNNVIFTRFPGVFVVFCTPLSVFFQQKTPVFWVFLPLKTQKKTVFCPSKLLKSAAFRFFTVKFCPFKCPF